MAAQILYAEEVDKELKFGKLDDTVNLTEFLREVVGDFFEEKTYFEEDDEISYKVIRYDEIEKLIENVNIAEMKVLDELKNVRGNEKKAELVFKLKDIALLNRVLFKALLQNSENSAKVIALL